MENNVFSTLRGFRQKETVTSTSSLFFLLLLPNSDYHYNPSTQECHFQCSTYSFPKVLLVTPPALLPGGEKKKDCIQYKMHSTLEQKCGIVLEAPRQAETLKASREKSRSRGF